MNRVIIKAIAKSLVEKKARSFLVLFSIAVSAAMVFANESFGRTVTARLREAGVRWSGTSDFYLRSKEVVGAAEWIDPGRLAAYGDLFEYAVPMVQGKALYVPSLEGQHYFTIIGTDFDAFNRHNPVTVDEGSSDNWGGDRIIIGRTYADHYGLAAGDVMRLEINNAAHDFTIAGISAPKGLFLRELADGGFILAPRATVAQMLGGDCNLIFLKLRDRSQREAVKARLTQDFDGYQVEYGVNDAVIAAETQNYVMPFQMSSVAVIVMCMFIIYTAFNLVTLERIPLVGTLRSIGASRRLINGLLIAESAALGAAGGLAGCVLGLGMLQYIKSVYFTGVDAISTTVVFGPREVLIAVAAAVVITSLSALLPIIRLTRTPIKNIILNDLGKGPRKPSRLWLAGAALLAACLLVPPFLGSSFPSMIIAGSLATGAMLGLIPLVPFLTGHIARLAARLPFLSHEVVLGVRNVRDNKSLMNNIQLFSAAIALVAFMASMFATMGTDLIKAYERDRYEISLVLRHSDPDSLARLAKTEGVKTYVGSYQWHAPVLNHGTWLNVLAGIDGPEFFDLSPVGGLDENQAALASLNQGRNIITTNVLKGKLGLKLGDTLLLELAGKQVPYTITGFVETNWGIGHVGYISSDNYRADMGVADYSYIYVQIDGQPDAVKNNLLRSLNKEVMGVWTKADRLAANADKVIAVFNAIRSYCYLALLVGLIGIVNNVVASVLERKRSFALYRCVGMSKRALNRMLVTEAVVMGVLGVGYGLGCALVMAAAIPAAVSVLWGKVSTQVAMGEMAVMGVVGILAMLAISLVPLRGSGRLSLIESLKYE
jgi:putative ABC transport system permease protein